jgi:hypothetical protein
MGTGGIAPDSDGHIGPATINNCQDAAKFANAPASGKLLYPYDGTIFPRGLAGPVLMWDGTADQILIEAKSSKFSYTECPTTPDGIRFKLDNQVWAGAGSWSDGTQDPLVINITTLSGGAPTGHVQVSVAFALASLKGALYYNTYGAPLGTPSVSNGNGAVLKILPGQDAPSLFLTDNGVAPFGPCRSCHALSANGMTMTANHHAYPAGPYESEVYDVAGQAPTLIKSQIPEAGFAGIFPDGSRMMTNGNPNDSTSLTFPAAPNNIPALVKSTSKLLDAKTATEIPSPGWNAPHAQMPMFSPDGKHIAYNDFDKGAGHSLWFADFDAGTNTFSGQKQIFNDATLYVGWPFFTPDAKQVVFQLGSRNDYASQLPLGVPPLMDTAGRGHLMIVDIASGKATPLDLANGWKGGQSYLPQGAARDNDLEFYPTVSPVAGGGFFWAFFTSRRTYGNLGQLGIEDPYTKKIWVTAISIDQPAGVDSSHPAFFLSGQEVNTGNLRAFAALEPCKEDGSSCTSGSECCKGFCSRRDPATGIGLCGFIEEPKCSKYNDKCSVEADCCVGAGNGAPRDGDKLYCLGGFCDLKTTG